MMFKGVEPSCGGSAACKSKRGFEKVNVGLVS
jgi:hypothetical protein